MPIHFVRRMLFLSMHIKQYSMLIGNILGHTFLLAVWLGIEYSFEHWIVPLFPIGGPSPFIIAFWIARALFLFTPLAFIVIWLRRDIACAWYKTRKEIVAAKTLAENVETAGGIKENIIATKMRIPLSEEAPK